MNIKCFVLERTNLWTVSLRRYAGTGCPVNHGAYHNAEIVIASRVDGDTLTSDSDGPARSSDVDRTDPRWPTHCGCGYQFQPQDNWQYVPTRLYQRADNPDYLVTLRDAPSGALWRNYWLEESPHWCGTDGQSWTCRLPNGSDWLIDGRASNCTMPKDNEHKCWCRHGVAPLFHVDKVGNTCQAGAGSIASGSYHGFLHNGELTNA